MCQTFFHTFDQSYLALVDGNELLDVTTLPLAFFEQILVLALQVRTRFDLLEEFFLKLLAVFKQLLVHLGESTKFNFDFFPSFS